MTDDSGAQDTVTRSITVENNPPNVNFSFAPVSPDVRDTVDFRGQSGDTDGTVIAWRWDLGDGTFSRQQNPSHVYTDTGSYLVELVVTDDDDSNTMARVVEVASSSSGGGGGGDEGSCLIGRSGLSESHLEELREWRDMALGSVWSRCLTTFYYDWFMR